MEHVLDIYKLPYDVNYPVVCMDESPKQLIEEIASTPIMQGQEARLDYEYIRHGMVNIFMANEPLKGKRHVEITEYKTKKDWAKFVKQIAELYPEAKCYQKTNMLYFRQIGMYQNRKIAMHDFESKLS